MALIKCPECGKEISDKAEICIGCGFPIGKDAERDKINGSERDAQEASAEDVADEVVVKYSRNERVRMVKELRERTGLGLSDALVLIEKRLDQDNTPQNTCHFCGSSSLDEDGYCNDCGMKATERIHRGESVPITESGGNINQKRGKQVEENYYSPLLKKRPKNRILRFLITLFLVVYSFVLFSGGSPENQSGNKDTQMESEPRKQSDETKKEEKDETVELSTGSESESISSEELFLNELRAYMDKDSAESLYDILKVQIGLTEFEFIEKIGETLNYSIIADGYDVVITDVGNDFRIFIPNRDIVFYENGEVITTAEILSMKEIDLYDYITYARMAESIIESCLKNPSSADFPSYREMSFEKFGDIVAVQGYVDAKNSFNAKVRSQWIVQFVVLDMDTYSCEPIYINIDGEKTGEFIEFE